MSGLIQRCGRVAALAAIVGAAFTASLTTHADADAKAHAPVAVAQGHRLAAVGERIELDASASFDADSERLTYRWTLESPAGSAARLSDAASPRPFFHVDLLGDYVARLIVSDGDLDSAPAAVRVSTAYVAPHVLGPTQIEAGFETGQALSLDARDALSPGSEPVTYSWSLRDAPLASRAVLSARTVPVVAFSPDVPGRYVLEARAKNARGAVAFAQFVLRSDRVAGAVDLGDDRRARLGSVVSLAPRDVPLDQASYAWRLRHAPRGSRAQFSRAAGSALSLDGPGLYVAQLVETSGAMDRVVDTVVVEAVAGLADAQGPLASPLFGAGGPSRGGSDIDGDGVPDDIDNCVETPNPNQIDTNGDGFGNRCDPDLDNDGLITNTIDLGLLRLAFFSQPGDPNWNPDADFNSDGIVNVVELGILRQFFFNAPGPIANEFTNPAGGSWHEPSNWSLGFVPNAAHAVRIDLAPGVDVEFSTGDVQISSIRTTSPLIISGGTLNVTRLAEFNDSVTMSGNATLENAPMIPPTVNPAAEFLIEDFQTVIFDGVVLANNLTIGRGANLDARNDLLLDSATITLVGDNNTSRLRFTGSPSQTSLLGGNGEVRFGGTTIASTVREILVSSTQHGLTIGPNVTVGTGTTGGRIRHTNNNGPITVQGTLEAGVADRTLSASGAPLTIEGDVNVSSDSIVQLVFQGSDGLFGPSATGTVTAGELEFNGAFTVEGSVDVTDGVLDLGTTDAAVWDNDGTITLVNSTVELGGAFDAAAVGNLSGTGTSVLNGVFNNVGQTVDLPAILPGGLELATPGRIVGGTAQGGALTLQAFQTFTLEGVTLASDITVERGGNLDVEDGLTFAGAIITLAGDNNTSRLRVEGPAMQFSTLGGTGEVRFGGTTTASTVREVLVSSSQHGLIIGPGVTVGSGTAGGRIRHGNNNGPIILQGRLEADLASRTVSMSAAPLTVEGDIDVSSDGIAELTFQGAGGVFAASATAVVNTGELRLFGSYVIEGNITVTDGALDLGTTDGANWDNNGNVVLNNATVRLGGGFTAASVGNITGTGTTVIDGTLDNTGQVIDLSLLAPGSLELATPGRVIGGTVQGSSLTVQPFQTFTLEGVTLGSDVTVERGGNLDVEGGLTLAGAVITLAGDNNASRLRFEGPVAQVSMFDGTGEVRFGGTTTASTVREVLVSSSQHGLTVGPNITIGSSTAGGRIRHQNNNGPITIQGTIEADVASRTVSISASPLTLSGPIDVSSDSRVQVTFQGTGGEVAASAVGTVNTGELEFGGEFTVEGTINVTDGIVDLGVAGTAPWANNGTITLSNATAQLGGSFDASSVGNLTGTGTSVIDGVFDNTGQTTDLTSLLPGALELANPGRVVGGTLQGTSLTVQDFQTFTLEAVTLGADVTVGRASNLDVDGGLTMAGATITLSGDNNTSRLRFTGAPAQVSTLGGNGVVEFGGTTTANTVREVLVSSTQHGLDIENGITVRSATAGGRIRHQNNNGPITVRGQVASNLSNRPVAISAFPLVIEGELRVESDGILSVTFQGSGGELTASSIATVNTGELALVGEVVLDGSITVTDGLLDIGDGTSGAWSNTGSIALVNATVELGGEFDAGAVGTLTGTGTSVINGVYDNVGLTLDAGSLLPGSIALGTPARINGGTITGTPLTVLDFQTAILDGVTLATDISVQRAANLDAENNLTLASGNVSLEGDNNTSRLRFRGAAAAVSTLGGNGEVRFAGATSANTVREVLVVSSQHGLLIDSGVTVRSDTAGGRIRHQNNNGPITVDGTVVSDLANRSVSLLTPTLQINGSLDVGAGAQLSLPDYTLGSGAQINLDIAGTATTSFGRVTSTGAATLDGTLNVALVNGFVPTPGDTFAVLTFASNTGTFALENIGGLTATYNPGNLTLTAN